MLPKWHFLFGLLFTLIVWLLFPSINYIYLILMFLASLFIDTDHYINPAVKTKSWNPIKAIRYYDKVAETQRTWKKKGIKRKEEDFQFLHPIEIHIIVLLLGFAWEGFFFIFFGMLFHSLLDVISLSYDKCLYIREYSLINWIIQKSKKANKSLSKK